MRAASYRAITEYLQTMNGTYVIRTIEKRAVSFMERLTERTGKLYG